MKTQNKRLIDLNSHKAMETSKISQHKPKVFHWLFSLMLILLTGWGSNEVIAQQFPVRATTVVTPPYSIYLSDYSSPESNSLQLILQLRDLDRPEYRAKLRLTIEGQGITIRTRPGYSPNPIILQGGIPETLTGFDLRGYLNPDNLDFIGISKSEFIRSGSLPEGFYTFTIEVLDFNRNVVVSNQAMANAWLILNDPPLVNLPFNGEKVRATDPQNILFSWTPRHTASPNAAFNTEYEFTLVELFPTGRNPNDAIQTSNPIFQTITSATSLNYSVAEPILIPGRQYAFTIRAFDVGKRDLFKNNGTSEVFVFQFGDECLAPTNLEASGLDPNRIELTWEGQEIHTEFDIRYRKEGTTEWFSENTFSNKQIVPELEGNTTYEYQIRGKCSTIIGPYSASSTIKTPEVDENEFACGADIQEVTLDNTPLNLQLKKDDEIETGDFKITITDIEANSDGSYKGMGIAQVPYLEFASIRVKFDAIKVNAGYRVFEGNITSIYDANSRFILDADLTGDELNQDGDDADGDGSSGDDIVIPNPGDDFFDNYDFEDTVSIDQPILDVQVNDDGDIVITYEDDDGNIKEEVVDPEEGGDTLITDSEGNSWGVDENGNVTANPTNTPSPIESIDEVDYIVTFKASPNQQYGFDNKTYNVGQYEQADIYGNDNPYWIGWKSVALGRQDQLLAITEKSNFPTEVGFKSTLGPGASQPADRANEKVLTVTGKAADAVETIDAYVNIGSDSSSQELILGKINVKTYTNIRKNLIIVPVNDASVPNESTLEEELNKIYGQAVTEWDITVQDRYEVSIDQIKGIADGHAGIFASFPPRMQQFNSDYRLSQPAFDQNAYYIFLVKGAEAGKAGFMPFKRQYGYVFTDELNGTPITKVIAHELGHGAFRLRHTFSEFSVTQGSTDNLMDYSNGTKLKKYQWDNVHDPESMISWLQDEEESEFYPSKDIVKNVLENLRCAYVNGAIAKIELDIGVTSASNIKLLDNIEYDKIVLRRFESSGPILINPNQTPEIRTGYGGTKYLKLKGEEGRGYLEIRVFDDGTELAESFDYLKPSSLDWADQIIREIKDIESKITSSNNDNDYFKNRLYSIGQCGLQILGGREKFKVVKLITNESRVNGEEEELVVNIIKSIEDEKNAKIFIDSLKSDKSGLLYELHISIDDENRRKLHSALTKVFFISKTSTIEKEVADLEGVIEQNPRLSFEQWSEKNVLYWLNPGLIKRFWETGTHLLRYSDLEIADNGKLSFNVEHIALVFSLTNFDVSIDPFELVRFQLLTSSKDLENGTLPGYYYLPAFSVVLLIKEQKWDEFNQALNTAFIFGTLGSGVLAAGGRTAVVELFFVSLNAASLIIDDYKVELSQTESGRTFLKSWEVFNASLAIWQVSKVVVALPKAYKNLQTAYRNLKNTNANTASKIKDGVTDALQKAEDAFPSIRTNVASSALDELFESYSLLKNFSKNLDKTTKSKLYDAVKDMDGNSLARLNRGLKATPTGNSVHTEFGNLILKLADDNPTGLKRLASSNWTDEMLTTLKGKLGRSEYPNILDDLSDPVFFNSAERMLREPINAKVFYDELLEANLSSAALERLSKSQFFKALKVQGGLHEEAVSVLARNGSRAPFSTWKADGFIHHAQFYLKRVGEKIKGTPKQTVSNGKNIIGDDVHIVKVFDDDGLFLYNRAKINDSKYTVSSPWTKNQKSELIDRFRNNKDLDYIEFEARSDLSKFPSTPLSATDNKVRVYRDDIFKTTSDGNGNINATVKVFQ